MKQSKKTDFSIAILRVLIGWHFLYEGLVKVFQPAWTSKAYLLDSAGWFRNFYFWLAGHDQVLAFTDALNAWGLTLIGFSLVIGLISRWAALGGMFILSLYYLSHPPFPGLSYLFPSDGSYFIVNKTLIELFCMFLLFRNPTDNQLGLQRLFNRK